jgi:hypothetical protein
MPVITRSQSKKVVASEVQPVITRNQCKDGVCNAIVIDCWVVSRMTEEGKYGREVRVRGIDLERQWNPTLDIDSLPRFSYGSRDQNRKVVIQLLTRKLNFEDVIRQI